ncbi:reverse transcriptase domain-containing protein [Trichonephila inaurata madagascariensis]|uniref:Reverse transcriptase domain-containing protein n=1 Tax=Trichonephila inaurata madagascariensis TaxID=2747483 RepID=A0A8X7CA65_9ARAC|nr:reverse transcriptase domain-containing protein [Trichonephila inaurata madagascariensis]
MRGPVRSPRFLIHLLWACPYFHIPAKIASTEETPNALRTYIKKREKYVYVWCPATESSAFGEWGAFKVPGKCSGWKFVATIKKHIRQFREDKPKSVERLDSSLYVDDLYFGAKDIYEAYELSMNAVRILKAAGMNLRKLNTNCEELKSMWIQQGLVRNDSGSNGQLKVLSLNWNTRLRMSCR